jgi:uncharacterized membrane protein
MQPPSPSNLSELSRHHEIDVSANTPDHLQARVRELEVQNRQLQCMVAELLAKNYELRLADAPPEAGYLENPGLAAYPPVAARKAI